MNLRIEHLRVSVARAAARRVVLDDVDLTLLPGRAVALVGESGSGKSLLAMACLGLLPRGARVEAGSVHLGEFNLLASNPEQLAALRGARISLVSESPRASLDPTSSVARLLTRVAAMHGLGRLGARRRGTELLTALGFLEPEVHFDDHPHELSEGDCQRLAIALALLNRPRVLLLDEPLAALDPTSRGQVVETLTQLRTDEQMGLLLISHDLGVVSEMAQDIAVMYAGKIVERGPLRAIFEHPTHPYTRGLLQSVPPLDVTGPPGSRRLPTIPGNIDHHTATVGCAFRLRCAYRHTEPAGFERCDEEAPQLLEVRTAHAVRCHYSEELS